jgi:DNA-binding NtrC family response regulator
LDRLGSENTSERLPEGPAEAAREHELKVLFVSSRDADAEVLARALEGTRWRVIRARSCPEAVPLLAAHFFPVIIRDEQCCDLGCIHAIRCAQTGLYPAPLIVATPSPQFRVWEDVIDRGGFEVLARPFDAANVRKIVEFAYKHWCQGDIRRRWDRFDFPD